MGVSEKTARRRLKEHGEYTIDEGIVVRKTAYRDRDRDKK